jgi:hypothetical protein
MSFTAFYNLLKINFGFKNYSQLYIHYFFLKSVLVKGIVGEPVPLTLNTDDV